MAEVRCGFKEDHAGHYDFTYALHPQAGTYGMMLSSTDDPGLDKSAHTDESGPKHSLLVTASAP